MHMLDHDKKLNLDFRFISVKQKMLDRCEGRVAKVTFRLEVQPGLRVSPNVSGRLLG